MLITHSDERPAILKLHLGARELNNWDINLKNAVNWLPEYQEKAYGSYATNKRVEAKKTVVANQML